MKKSIILVFLIALLLTISACSNSEEESVHDPDMEHMDLEKQEQVESNDQLTKETEASEEEVEGFEEILKLEENKSLTQLYKKYSEVLMQILIDRTDSNGKYFDDGSQGVDFSRNCFAIMDIDGDGRDELIFNFNDTYMAAMQEIMYDYDEKTDILQTELESSYVMNTYYSNGYVKVGASHNHTCDPQTRGVWPYSVYQYNPQKDSYSDIGYVQCWDGLIFPTDYDGAVFPGELDTDGDNLLFSVSYYVNGTDEVECTYMNREEFEEWEQTMFPDEYKINIEYHPMTEEEITQLTGIKSQNSVNGSEEIKKIREYIIPEQSFDISLNDWGEVTFVSCMPMPDSDGYTDPHADVSFYLVSGEQLIYRFPYINQREGIIASPGVSFVTFADVNEDGKDDVVIGILYYGVGYMQQTDPLMEVRIYIDNGDQFVHDKSRFDEYSGLDHGTTAAEVKDMLRLS